MLICAGCSATGNANKIKGIAAARVHLQPYPAKCRQPTPHAKLVVGDSTLSALDRERAQVDKANAKANVCADFYEDQRKRLK